MRRWVLHTGQRSALLLWRQPFPGWLLAAPEADRWQRGEWPIPAQSIVARRYSNVDQQLLQPLPHSLHPIQHPLLQRPATEYPQADSAAAAATVVLPRQSAALAAAEPAAPVSGRYSAHPVTPAVAVAARVPAHLPQSANRPTSDFPAVAALRRHLC